MILVNAVSVVFQVLNNFLQLLKCIRIFLKIVNNKNNSRILFVTKPQLMPFTFVHLGSQNLHLTSSKNYNQYMLLYSTINNEYVHFV